MRHINLKKLFFINWVLICLPCVVIFAHANIVKALTPLPQDHIIYSNTINGIRSIKSDGTGDTQLVSDSTVPNATNPMLTPDRATIYFQNNTGEVYKANVDGSGVTDLHYTTSNQTAVLSPNGKKIAYLIGGVWAGGNAIAIRNVDGTGTVTDIHQSTAGNIYEISWASDSKIVYSFSSTTYNDCYMRIASINADGTGFMYLSPDNSSNPPNTCGTPRRPSVNSSTGKVVYSVTNSHVGLNGSQALYTVNLDGTNNQFLFMPPTKTQPNGSITYGGADYPRWSSDGSYIAAMYSDPNQSTHANIGIISAGGTFVEAIGTSASNKLAWGTPVILTDDILYSTMDGIHSVNDDGTNNTLLISTASVPSARNPMISPDRGTIYFQDFNNNGEVYKANADGTGITDLGYSTGVVHAALSPDGSQIAYLIGGVWAGGNTIRIRSVDGAGATNDIHQSTYGYINDIAWASNTKLVYSFSENSGNDCYNFIVSLNTDETGFTYLTPDNTGNTPNTCATPKEPDVNLGTGEVTYYTLNPHLGINGLESLYTVNLDGSNNQLIFTPPSLTEPDGSIDYGGIDTPRWSPDGQYIVAGYSDPNTPSSNHIGIIDVSTDSLLRTIAGAGWEFAWAD